MSSVDVLGAEMCEVVIGSTVDVEWDDGRRGTYLIASESDLARNVIGLDAPLARAIYGASTGEVRPYCTRLGVRTVVVRRVHGLRHVA